eukprot:scaffold78380_cov61-Phaeocystis_antarctica.AAC.6
MRESSSLLSVARCATDSGGPTRERAAARARRPCLGRRRRVAQREAEQSAQPATRGCQESGGASHGQRRGRSCIYRPRLLGSRARGGLKEEHQGNPQYKGIQVHPAPARKYIRPCWVSCLLCPCLKYIKALPRAAAAARRRCALSSYGQPYAALEAASMLSNELHQPR